MLLEQATCAEGSTSVPIFIILIREYAYTVSASDIYTKNREVREVKICHSDHAKTLSMLLEQATCAERSTSMPIFIILIREYAHTVWYSTSA